MCDTRRQDFFLPRLFSDGEVSAPYLGLQRSWPPCQPPKLSRPNSKGVDFMPSIDFVRFSASWLRIGTVRNRRMIEGRSLKIRFG
jgi:hypothetical protein